MRLYSKWIAAAILGSCAAMPIRSYADSSFEANRTDFRDETIYFAMTTRFYDGDPMNNVLCWDGQADQIKNNDPCWRGDFAGLIEKLDYIKALGFTAIWITPIVQNASGFDYHGYHAMDFSKVDLRYESRTEWGCEKDVKFEDLIQAAHKKGIKIILDIVLQHTGNFGEDRLCKLFERDQNIKNQADIESCLIPDQEKLGGSDYWKLPNDGEKTQYSERFKYLKNTRGQNLDTNNYWHHVADAWNWDSPTRWWGQIAGDCVDLNTENQAVVDYLVKCYGEFIKMGLDGFRIDTTGHIAPLTFNAAFIPEFIKLGEEYKNKRYLYDKEGNMTGVSPFYMFGECCARYGSVVYRDQHVLSSHYYTWKSDPQLVAEWKSYTADWWAQQNVPEGAAPLGNMLTCESDPATVHNSNNVFLQNGKWHEPDYSQASGFNVIDFPMHYNFNSAGEAVNIAKSGDHYYNDASWNVVYVDSHDYCPGPNDGTRFNGGTGTWAENLALMFTFRGIPCIYYGSEVEFQKGVTIDKGPLLALKESGRAYYGAYLEGDIETEDFGKITRAEGNVQKTLNGDLSQHIRRLNLIRQAVPALRKGQYTFDDCEAKGGYAFKRAYKDSYALVAVNGGATFKNVPAGTYTDLVTGKTYTGGGSITVDAPSTQGQLRVLVKDWTGGKVGEHGKFIYDTTPVSHGGSVRFSDPGTTQYYTKDDATGPTINGVKFSPAGGSFRTETQTVKVSLESGSVSGWYQVEGKDRINLTSGNTSSFTIGDEMDYGQTVSVAWGATSVDGANATGSVSYKKVDPNAAITVYIDAPAGTNLYAWGNVGGTEVKLNGAWPGKTLQDKIEVNGTEYYYFTATDVESFNIIINDGSGQTPDITGISEDTYFKYNGGAEYEKVEVQDVPVRKNIGVNVSPAGGSFKTDTQTVTLSLTKDAVSGWYQVTGQGRKDLTKGKTTTVTIGEGVDYGKTIVIDWKAKGDDGTEKTGTASFKKVAPAEGINVYVTGSGASDANLYIWGNNGGQQVEPNGGWPGGKITETEVIEGVTYYCYTVENLQEFNMILNDGFGQTGDIKGIKDTTYIKYEGGGNYTLSSVPFGGNADPIDPVQPTGDCIVYFDNSGMNWTAVTIHYWGGSSASQWPGVAMKQLSCGHYYYSIPKNSTGIVFNHPNDENMQSDDISPVHGTIYKVTGSKSSEIVGTHNCIISGVETVYSADDAPAELYNLQGVKVTNPGPGLYIVVKGNKSNKIVIR